MEDATGIRWAEVRDAVRHSTRHRTVSHNKPSSGNVNRDRVEKHP